MTTEDDFWRAIDAAPDDRTLRLVFADWLQEHDDDRAEGMRAIAAIRRFPLDDKRDGKYCWFRSISSPIGVEDSRLNHRLPDDWFCIIQGNYFGEMFHHWFNFDSRREAEDAACRAFLKLSPERRAELLNSQVPA